MPESVKNNDILRAQQARTVRGVGEIGAANNTFLSARSSALPSDHASAPPYGTQTGTTNVSTGKPDFGAIVSALFGNAVGGSAAAGGSTGGVIGGRATFSVAEGGRLQSAFSVNGQHIGGNTRGGRASSAGPGGGGVSSGGVAGGDRAAAAEPTRNASRSSNGVRDASPASDKPGSEEDERSTDEWIRGMNGRSSSAHNANGFAGAADPNTNHAFTAGGPNTEAAVSSSGVPTAAELSPATVGQFNAMLLSGDRGVRPIMVSEQASSERLGQQTRPHTHTPMPTGLGTNPSSPELASVVNTPGEQQGTGTHTTDGDAAMIRTYRTEAPFAKIGLAGHPASAQVADGRVKPSLSPTNAAGASDGNRAWNDPGQKSVNTTASAMTSAEPNTRSIDRAGTRDGAYAMHKLVSENSEAGRPSQHRDGAQSVWKLELSEPSLNAGIRHSARPDHQTLSRQSINDTGIHGQRIEGSATERLSDGGPSHAPPTHTNQHRSNSESGERQTQDRRSEHDERRRADPSAEINRPAGDSSSMGESQRVQALSEIGRLADSAATTQGEDLEETERLARQALAAQVSRGMSAFLRGGSGGQATIALAPAMLGQLKIAMKIEDGTVSATFRPTTDQARGLLSGSLDALRASLEAGGLRVDRLEVDPVEERAAGAGAAERAPAEGRTKDRASSAIGLGVERQNQAASAEPADNTTRTQSRASAEVRLRLDATA